MDTLEELSYKHVFYSKKVLTKIEKIHFAKEKAQQMLESTVLYKYNFPSKQPDPHQYHKKRKMIIKKNAKFILSYKSMTSGLNLAKPFPLQG